VELKFKVELMPLWDTLEDIFDLVVSCILLLFSINQMIELCNGYNILTEDNEKTYWLMILYFTCGFVNWIYRNNRKKWHYRDISYTDYFDMDGSRIAKKDKVIYNGKLYKIFCDSDVIQINKSGTNKDSLLWLVNDSDGIIHKTILLEEAAKDEKGKLTVYKYGMGERR
jgi:hypothetical protein